MAERNLIGEGFVTNTLAPGGTVSGTQTVSISEINNLVDEDFITTALLVSGTFFTSLDADLGARWKLSKLQLYTDEPSNVNFDMSVSVDNVDFFPITMTGSAGLWEGPVSGTTVSGAPRYIRYEHNAASDRLVQEWRALNDDTLVDFGTTGTQTEVVINDAPIGQPSTQITTLPLFNSYTKTAQGSVFIDNTGNKGDDNVEISTRADGPWFGRQTQSAIQPDNTPWIEEDSLGVFKGGVYEGADTPLINLRTVSGTAYKTDFSGGVAGWSSSGFTSLSSPGNSIRGNISTNTSPAFKIDNTFGSSAALSPDSVPDISNDFLPFRAEDYDTIEVVLISPTLQTSDFIEGPRLFWRNQSDTLYDSARSTLSLTPGANFTGESQTFTFDVGNVPTWSGVMRSFKVQNYTTATGIGITSIMNSLEAYHGDKRERVALQLGPVISGSFMGGGAGTGRNTYAVAVNTENPVKESCIITSVFATVRAPRNVDNAGWFLVRWVDGFEYDDTAASVNGADPFEVLQFAVAGDRDEFGQRTLFTKQSVLWGAEPGDMIGYGYSSDAFAGGGPSIGPEFIADGAITVTSGCLASVDTIDINGAQSNAGLSTELNNISNWVVTGQRFAIKFDAISAGKYVANGTYTTPIFDGGGDPALLSVQFDTEEENGTSIDVSGSAAFDTVQARASSTPPNTAVNLGRRINQFALGAHPTDIPAASDPSYDSNYIIGLFNAEVSGRESSATGQGDVGIENIAMGALYHENKQELWLMNLLISGTQSSDMRPSWCAYDLETGTYLRTEHVTGSITYFHTNNGAGGGDINVFEPAGWVADYDREELYIISREDEFSVGAGTYNGLILDLDGQFKDVFWRNDQLTQDLVDAGLQVTTALADRYLQNMRTVTYRAPYFYSITSGETQGTTDSNKGLILQIYRLGNNPSDPENVNDVEFVHSVDLTTVPGLSAILVDPSVPVETFTYCKANDLFYFTTGSAIYTISISRTGTPPTESFVVAQGSITEETLDQLFVNPGLSEGFILNDASLLTNWTGAGFEQQLRKYVDWTYASDRDSFVMINNYLSIHSRDFARNGEFTTDYFLFHLHNHSMIEEVAADTAGFLLNTPSIATQRDPVWGTLAGTLAYVQVQEDSILFPTGRFAQIQYSLNSDPGRYNTPYLIESRVSQGIRVSDIPANSSKNIFLRTNIPEREVIGDQTGRLKVFWELEAV